MKHLLNFLIISSFCIHLSGCVPAAIGYMAYKFSEAKTESAEKVQRSTDFQTYTNYRVDMERVNLDREKANLKPRPIMSQEEWISAQTAGRPPIAPIAPDPKTDPPSESRGTIK